MPGPRGGGRGRRRRGKMGRVRRFLEPCLLLLLRQGESHGYKLVNELEKFGFDPETLDPSLVYRALRDMEDTTWIRSRWDDASQGPPRRVYELAAEGESQLEAWVEGLRQTRNDINRLLHEYKSEKSGDDG